MVVAEGKEGDDYHHHRRCPAPTDQAAPLPCRLLPRCRAASAARCHHPRRRLRRSGDAAAVVPATCHASAGNYGNRPTASHPSAC